LIKSHGQRVIVFCDFDGTLAETRMRPEEVVLTPERSRKLQKLNNLNGVDLNIVSGRTKTYLNSQFDSSFQLMAEHGALWKEREQTYWEHTVFSNYEIWHEQVRSLMEDYVKHVKGSFIETKEFCLTWHYRLSESPWTEHMAIKLKEELQTALANLPASVISGHKIIEVRPAEASKAHVINRYLASESNDSLVIVIGDDTTDEEMFNCAKSKGISFRVGAAVSTADYWLGGVEEVYTLLDLISEIITNDSRVTATTSTALKS